jgi:Domain of unknown function (DUF1906)
MPNVNGFDCEHYPGDKTIGLLRQLGQFRIACLYLAHYPNSEDTSWISKRSYLAANGWGFIPTYAGLQLKNPKLAAGSGQQHGTEAATLMKRAGFTEGSVVYLDLESGDTPAGAFLTYVTSWISSVQANGFTPGLYCSHRITSWALSQTKFVWSFHIPDGTFGQTYDPDELPKGSIDKGCIATQYRQKINLKGIPISSAVDGDGFDLSLCGVADPSNPVAARQALDQPARTG